jgi:hypothetical protein
MRHCARTRRPCARIANGAGCETTDTAMSSPRDSRHAYKNERVLAPASIVDLVNAHADLVSKLRLRQSPRHLTGAQ